MAAHMDPEEFRRNGYAVIDWIADYWTTLADRPVTPADPPGAVAALLPAGPPERGEPFDRILADLDTVVIPGLTHWQHPGFFGYFPANTSGPERARRPGQRRARGAGHALGDRAGLHRGGDGDAGLAGRAARPAGPVPLHRRPAAG